MITAPKNNVQENKQMPTLVPMDILLRYLEPAYREGLIKYYRESWRLGFPVSIMIDAALRHIIQFFYEKEDFDVDAEKLGVKKHHLAGAIFSLICVLQTLEKHPELDDRNASKEAQSEIEISMGEKACPTTKQPFCPATTKLRAADHQVNASNEDKTAGEPVYGPLKVSDLTKSYKYKTPEAPTKDQIDHVLTFLRENR